MCVGGVCALGQEVGVGLGVRVGSGGVGDGFGGVVVGCHSGRSAGVGPPAAGDWVGRGVGVGGSAGVDVGVAEGSAVWSGAVTATTTAPSSVMTGSGGALTRVQIPQPKPVRSISTPRINMLRDRNGIILRIAVNPISVARPCQVELSYGIIESTMILTGRCIRVCCGAYVP